MIEFVITCDGGSLNNQSEDRHGYGSFMLTMTGTPVSVIRPKIDFGKGVTNNQAEYKALLAALNHITDSFTSTNGNLKAVKLRIRTDSQLVIGHLMKGHKIKHTLKPLVEESFTLLEQFDSFVFEHIPGDEMKAIIGH